MREWKPTHGRPLEDGNVDAFSALFDDRKRRYKPPKSAVGWFKVVKTGRQVDLSFRRVSLFKTKMVTPHIFAQV
jgi:hypothetical protein